MCSDGVKCQMGIQKLALVVKSGIMVEKQFEPKMFQFNCELSYIVSVFGSSDL